MKIVNQIFILIFFAISVLPVAMLAAKTDFGSVSENRVHAQAPHIPKSIKDLSEFPKLFDKYLGDNFGLRSEMVRLNSILSLDLLSTSPSAQVLLGSSGRLFFRGDKSIESYRSFDLLSDEGLISWRNFFQVYKNQADKLGIPLIIMVAPNASTIYGQEFLPNWVTKSAGPSRFDQIKALLREMNIPIADTRDALLSAAKTENVYFKTDTHWNELGAFLGYQALVQAIPKSFNIQPISRANIDVKEESAAGGDLAGMMGLHREYREMNPKVVVRQGIHRDVEKISGVGYQGSIQIYRCNSCDHLILYANRDSFLTAVIPFFSQHFADSTFAWTANVDWHAIKESKPDIIVFETAERFLMFPPQAHINVE